MERDEFLVMYQRIYEMIVSSQQGSDEYEAMKSAAWFTLQFHKHWNEVLVDLLKTKAPLMARAVGCWEWPRTEETFR